MERHFISAKDPIIGWSGRVIQDTTTGLCLSHPEWPKLFNHRGYLGFFATADSLDNLVRSGMWKEVAIDPDLELDEGL